MTVGFIGLGKMGGPMAANVVTAAPGLLCFDMAGTEARMPAGAIAAESISDLAGRCETVFISVPDGAASLAVAKEILGSGQSIVHTLFDLSTIGPRAATEVAALLQPAGITYCDGPVSGGAAGARAATISLMFSGPIDVLEANRSLLESFTGNVFNVGDQAGQGQAMKLANNFLSATALAASSEAVAFGVAHGLDMATMIDVLNVSTGRNSATVDKFPNRILTGSYDAGFSTAHMTKDVGLFVDGAVDVKTASTVASAVTETWRGCDAAMPGSDFTEIWRYVSTL
ncbi:MAG TPA: NAD(P)-dependent oxidoreductase [Ilumatobacteraceae bacterium]|jgi:3-hydroxyisobutyrate dehydrogenase|nr:NAD(P)-dependent oxidoreductase [Ilumatobacteraceae bacterium]